MKKIFRGCSFMFLLQVVTALGKVWHPEHFVCTECETELGSRNFFEKDGRPYCESDYFTLFSPHCAQCNKPILNVRDSNLHASYNPELILTWTTQINTPGDLKPFNFSFLLFRKWSPLWIRIGTRSVSAVLSAAGRLERKVMGGTSCLGFKC